MPCKKNVFEIIKNRTHEKTDVITSVTLYFIDFLERFVCTKNGICTVFLNTEIFAIETCQYLLALSG